MQKVRIGVIGLGRLGYEHARNVAFNIINTQLVAVCDIREDHAKNVAKELGAEYVFTDYTELINHPDVDAVLIANPPEEHCACIKAACDAKKHIYCEKPTGVSIDEMDEIDIAVEQNPGKVVQVGFVRRFDATYAEAMERIQNGEIGNVIKVRSVSCDPADRKKDYVELGPSLGGMFYDMLVHDLDLIRWYAGAEAKSVYAIGGIYEFKEFESFGDIDNCSVAVQFENGVVGIATNSKNAACGYDVWLEIMGTKGSLLVSTGATSDVVIKDEHGIRRVCQPWFRERFKDAYEKEVFIFAKTILENGQSKMSAKDARKAVEMSYMAEKSYKTGKVVKSSF